MFIPMNICISMCMVNQVTNTTNINNMTKYATLIAKKLHINFNLKRENKLLKFLKLQDYKHIRT